MPPDYSIATMGRDDLARALEWADAEGWNPGLDDVDSFRAADPGGFFVGRLGDRPVASISAVRYGASFGFIGLYIVDAPLRGQGYGLAIWNRAIESLKGRTIGLDGVVAQQANYQKSGFRIAHRNIRFAGPSRAIDGGSRAVSLSSIDHRQLAGFDRRFFPDVRDDFLRAWIRRPEGQAVGIVEGGELLGYGVIRRSRAGYRIGPLFAEYAGIAQELFETLTAAIPPGTDVFLDIPEANAEGVKLAERNGLGPSFETARMYAGPAPDLPLGKIFGITSLELG